MGIKINIMYYLPTTRFFSFTTSLSTYFHQYPFPKKQSQTWMTPNKLWMDNSLTRFKRFTNAPNTYRTSNRVFFFSTDLYWACVFFLRFEGFVHMCYLFGGGLWVKKKNFPAVGTCATWSVWTGKSNCELNFKWIRLSPCNNKQLLTYVLVK